MNNYKNTTKETTETPVPNLSKLDSRRWQKSQYETAKNHLTKHKLGRTPRHWPARLTTYPHWKDSFDKAAQSAGLEITLEDAVAQVNAWLDEIDDA